MCDKGVCVLRSKVVFMAFPSQKGVLMRGDKKAQAMKEKVFFHGHLVSCGIQYKDRLKRLTDSLILFRHISTAVETI